MKLMSYKYAVLLVCAPFVTVVPLIWIALLPAKDLTLTVGSPFIMYSRDLNLCAATDDLDGSVFLRACNRAVEIWTFDHNGALSGSKATLCLTVFSNVTHDWHRREQKDNEHVVANQRNLDAVKMDTCQSKKSNSEIRQEHLDEEPLRLHGSELQVWTSNGSNLAFQHDDLQPQCLWFVRKMRLFIFKQDSTTLPAVLRDCQSGPGLSEIVEFRYCDSPTFCSGHGHRIPGTCICKCDPPWCGDLCTQVDVDRKLTCNQKQAVGPAPEFTLSHLWTHVRLLLWPLHNAIFSLVRSCWDFIRPILLTAVVLLPESISDAERRLLTAQFLLWGGLGGILFVCFVGFMVCFFVAIWQVLQFLLLFPLFPWYAKFNHGQWPHADRAILFCTGGVEWSTYIFLPNVLLICAGFADAAKLIWTEKCLSDPAKVFGFTMPFNNATMILMKELMSLLTVLCLFIRGGDFFEMTIKSFLALGQVCEVTALAKTLPTNSRDSHNFRRVELIFAMSQDLPQFLFTAWKIFVSTPDQVDFYCLGNALATLLREVLRSTLYYDATSTYVTVTPEQVETTSPDESDTNISFLAELMASRDAFLSHPLCWLFWLLPLTLFCEQCGWIGSRGFSSWVLFCALFLVMVPGAKILSDCMEELLLILQNPDLVVSLRVAVEGGVILDQIVMEMSLDAPVGIQQYLLGLPLNKVLVHGTALFFFGIGLHTSQSASSTSNIQAAGTSLWSEQLVRAQCKNMLIYVAVIGFPLLCRRLGAGDDPTVAIQYACSCGLFIAHAAGNVGQGSILWTAHAELDKVSDVTACEVDAIDAPTQQLQEGPDVPESQNSNASALKPTLSLRAILIVFGIDACIFNFSCLRLNRVVADSGWSHESPKTFFWLVVRPLILLATMNVSAIRFAVMRQGDLMLALALRPMVSHLCVIIPYTQLAGIIMDDHVLFCSDPVQFIAIAISVLLLAMALNDSNDWKAIWFKGYFLVYAYCCVAVLAWNDFVCSNAMIWVTIGIFTALLACAFVFHRWLLSDTNKD